MTTSENAENAQVAIMRLAGEVFEAGKFDEAMRVYTAALQQFGANQTTLIRLADLYVKAGDLNRAAEHIATLRQDFPTFPWTPMIEADLSCARLDYEKAITLYREALTRMPGFAPAEGRMQSLIKQVSMEKQWHAPAELQTWPASGHADFLTAAPEDRVLVVSWDIGHNVAGRGITLAETICDAVPAALAGPMFPLYNDDLWGPLASGDRRVPIFGWHAPYFRHLMEGALRLVRDWPAQTVWVSKARFPGMLIGLLYKEILGATILCDIDDDELAFVKGEGRRDLETFLADLAPQEWAASQNKDWTELALGMVETFDGVTACNPVLCDRFDGVLVRHGRRKEDADVAISRRHRTRSEFNFGANDKVVLFLGTPRRHKGLLELAGAVAALGRPDAVLCIVGPVVDSAMERELEAIPGLRLKRLDAQPFSRVLDINAMADVVVLLQDRASAISQSQTPAKLTDAVAVGTIVLVTDVPPVRDVIASGAAMGLREGDSLVDRLSAALNQSASGPKVHPFFEREMAYAPNCKRALEAIKAARKPRTVLNVDTPKLLRFIDREMPGHVPEDLAKLAAPYLRGGSRVMDRIDPDRPVNIVFFWKQNDTSIYGRRQDMLLKELANRPEVGRVLHIEAPFEVTRLQFQPNPMRPLPDHERQLISSNTLMRMSGFADSTNLHQRSFVMGKEHHTLLGRKVPGIESFPNAVDNWLEELDMRDNCIAWVCPVVDAFPDVQRRIRFPFIVSDYIDDQRYWKNSPERHRQLDINYRFMADCTDVSVANCQSVLDRIRQFDPDALLVSNGVDTLDERPAPAEEILRLGDKIIGYCGNMDDRFDFDLIEALSRARPDYQIVLIGKLSRQAERDRMNKLANLHVLGVRRHDVARACIAAFDVAMIPHERNDLSDRMNPLKAYVYRSLGVPVVASDVANLYDLQDEVRVARKTEDFIKAVDESLEDRKKNGLKFMPKSLSDSLSWKNRCDEIWARVDHRLREKFPE